MGKAGGGGKLSAAQPKQAKEDYLEELARQAKEASAKVLGGKAKAKTDLDIEVGMKMQQLSSKKGVESLYITYAKHLPISPHATLFTNKQLKDCPLVVYLCLRLQQTSPLKSQQHRPCQLRTCQP